MWRVALCSGLIASCGSEAGWLPDDLDEEATLSAIGDTGYARACDAFEGYLLDRWRTSTLVEVVCTAQAIEATTEAEACADQIAACVATPPPAAQAAVDAILAQASCDALDVAPGSCSSTLGALVACLDALDAEVGRVRLVATCAAAGETVEPGWDLLELPAECASLANAC